jgi:hypothetical protein
MSSGKAFHHFSPITWNDLSAILVLVLGTLRLLPSTDLREYTDVFIHSMLLRYTGAVPFRHLSN